MWKVVVKVDFTSGEQKYELGVSTNSVTILIVQSIRTEVGYRWKRVSFMSFTYSYLRDSVAKLGEKKTVFTLPPLK